MKVLIVEPGRAPREAETANELEALQKIVGGYIEVVRPFEDRDVLLVCNEEGWIRNLRFNRRVCGQQIFGTFFLCRAEGEEFVGLTEEQIERCMFMMANEGR